MKRKTAKSEKNSVKVIPVQADTVIKISIPPPGMGKMVGGRQLLGVVIAESVQ